MGLIYDEETAEYQTNPQYYNDIETKQQGLGLTANDTERITNVFAFSAAVTSSTTINQPVILTAIAMSSSAVAPGISSVSLSINNTVIAGCNSRDGSVAKVIAIPSWELKETDILTINIATVGSGESRGEFIGYFA